MAANTKNLTEGGIKRVLLSFATPLFLSQLFQQLKRAMAADKLSDAAACCKGLGLTLAEAEALLREAWEPKE